MKVSIITVSYNSANTIEDTIRSVDNQTYRNFEHLIIDGASHDATLDIVKKFQNISRSIFSEPDFGIYDAMNKGLLKANGDIIGFLNADDMYSDEFALEKIVSAFMSHMIDVSFGDLVYVSQDNDRLIRYWKSKPYVDGLYPAGWSPAHPTFYIRRAMIEKVGCFSLDYPIAADFEFMLRCLKNYQLTSHYIPNVLVRMRVGGLSNSSFKNMILQNKEILSAMKKNNVGHSFFKFFFYKILNRLRQRLLARYKQIFQDS